MATGRNKGYVFAWVCTVLVAWTAPNALLLYRWRWKFLNAGKKSRAANPPFVSAAVMCRTTDARRVDSRQCLVMPDQPVKNLLRRQAFVLVDRD
jgi:hypothetical protein